MEDDDVARVEPAWLRPTFVASIVGFLKGKSAIAIARQFVGKEQNFTGEHFWARGYAVSTVGFNLDQVKAYRA